MQQKFLPQEARAFENNIEQKLQKSSPRLKKYIIYLKIIFALPPMQTMFFFS